MSDPLDRFDPAVAGWFRERFRKPTAPQAAGWPRIAAGGDILITAPTGSGKTLAAFLHAVDRLVRLGRAGRLDDRARVVYVSPLKALSADVRRNLESPLAGIAERAAAEGEDLPPIRAALRTGDTSSAERARIVRKPPHILVTTPESLYLLLTARRGREMLRDADSVIVDEIHALARDKRGSHLALSLERLDRLAGRRLQRIGLSATVRPLRKVARFLSPRDPGPAIVPIGHRRRMDLRVEVPGTELGAVATHDVMEDIRDRLVALIEEQRTTLVFANTRRMAEQLTHALGERLPAKSVAAHHGSLARSVRAEAERRLAAGELRAIVATASLELGIDIGSVDLVCQLGSPRSIAVALQRVGRSGHWLGATPVGRLFPTTRDDLIECAALVRAIRAGELDRVHPPEAPLDVLAQQLVAEAAGDPDERLPLDDLFAFVRQAWPYRRLSRRDFDAVIAMLAEGISASRGRRAAWLHRDSVAGTVRARRGARLAALLNGGAIPETAQYQVVAEPDDRVVGQVDEDFAIESYRGDVFVLGTQAWRIRRIASGQVRVEDAFGASPTIPFWRGEAPGRTRELSGQVSDLRERVEELGPDAGMRLLREEAGLDAGGAGQAVRYLEAGRAALSAVPSRRTVIAERFFDESGGMQLVIHAPFGSRINRGWGLALRKRFCRSFNIELQAAATDNGIVISLTELHSFPLESVFSFLHPRSLEAVLRQALLAAPMFASRWRWAATRALAVPRRRGGRKVPPPIQRMLSDDLLAAVFPDQAACAENLAGEVSIPQHPLVDEAIRDCLAEAMDFEGLREVIAAIRTGAIRTLAVETTEVSPFAAEILNANPYAFLDPAPLEERRARAVRMARALPPSLESDAVLDPAAVEQAAEEAAPLVRDADELHDALLTLGALPRREDWAGWFGELSDAGRALTVTVSVRSRPVVLWMAIERLALARAVWPDAAFGADAPPGSREAPEEDGKDPVAALLRGVVDSSGPASVAELATAYGLSEARVEAGLLALEAEGTVLRGRFRALARPAGEPGKTDSAVPAAPEEWCHRRVLARMHRLTLGRLRRASRPVSAVRYLEFLAAWQHATPATRLHGPRGVTRVVEQLQGLEAPAAAWEGQILANRIRGYRREWLDENCLSGRVVWGRISRPGGAAQGRRPLRPTRAAPVALLPRGALALFLPPPDDAPAGAALSGAARRVLELLEGRGAQFFQDLEASARLLPATLEDALWELVARGFVTADGFDNLRALVDPRRRAATGRFRRGLARHAPGRWAVFHRPPGSEPEAEGDAEADEELARTLLARWGVLFRDLLKRDRLTARWRRLQLVLRRMEMRGEVLGGRFVSTIAGEQFALAEAVERLRRRTGGKDVPAAPVRFGAADPLNLTGILLPGPRVPASARDWLVLDDGVVRRARSGPGTFRVDAA